MAKITLKTLADYKRHSEKFTVLTCYDASFAKLLSSAGIDVILIGDTLGNVIQGHATTIPVTIHDAAYHTRCVSRGNDVALLIGDMPFMSYAESQQALENACKLMQAGAHLVKMEGGDWLCDTVHLLSERGIPSCVHLGLQPQSVHSYGGYKVQGCDAEQAERIIASALALQQAGASLLVLECVPTQLAAKITEQLSIPTIGIGAGPYCDGQVLVLYDMLGIGLRRPLKFVHNFMADAENHTIEDAIKAYINAVKNETFPKAEHSF